jgi:Sulfotransferase family
MEIAASPLPSVLLVRGCARSGTSLVTELLNDDPAIALLSEYALGTLARDLRPIFAYESERKEANAKSARLFADEAGEDDGLRSISPRYASATDFYVHLAADRRRPHYPTAARFAAILTAVVASSLGKRDVRIVGSKTPGTVADHDRDIGAAGFPAVRYLFVVRNPLDTINSNINRRNLARYDIESWYVDDVAGAIDAYRESVRYLFAHVAAYGDDCFVVKYEDVIERYAEVSAQLSAFLGVQLEPHTQRIDNDRTPKLVMTAEESAFAYAQFEDAIRTWPRKTLTGLGTSVCGALADCVDVAEPNRTYRYGSASPGRHFLGLGWNEIDAHGVWSRATHADLFFRVPEDRTYALHVEISTFAAASGSSADVSIELDGTTLFRGLAVPVVVCGPVLMRAGEAHRLSFLVDAVRSPAECGLSDDARKLGVCLHSIVLAAAGPASTRES